MHNLPTFTPIKDINIPKILLHVNKMRTLTLIFLSPRISLVKVIINPLRSPYIGSDMRLIKSAFFDEDYTSNEITWARNGAMI